MLPFLHIGPLTIPLYGLMITTGVAAGALLIWLRSRSLHFNFEDGLYTLAYGMVGMAVGSKLLYLIQSLPQLPLYVDEIRADPTQLFSLLTSGFVFYGGLIGGIAGVLIYSRQYHIPFRESIDRLAPVIPFIHAFGRIGCFCAGCCYGIPYDGPLSVTFTQSIAAPNGVPLFPVQLLESLLLFGLAAGLLLYERRAKQPRSLIAWYLLGYGLIRMITEAFRGDQVRGIYWLLSTSQWISVLMIAIALALLLRRPRIPESEPIV